MALSRNRGRKGPPGGIATQGKLYWDNKGTSRGKRSGLPWGHHGKGGDFYQCVARLSKHMTPQQAKGYCAERHHDATGQWPGRKRKMNGTGVRHGGRRTK